jgi:hypothetical protein
MHGINKTCKICGSKDYYAKYLCYKHYNRYHSKIYYDKNKDHINKRGRGELRKFGMCKIEGCSKGIYAKGYCKSHYRSYRLGKKFHVIKKCKRYNCKNKVYWSKSPYCEKCRTRAKNYKGRIPWSKTRSEITSMNTKGNKNVNWKGGVFFYKDHYKLKKNRLIKIKEQKGKCEECKEPADKVSHIDKSRDNHELSNLKLLCDKCFGKSNRKRQKISKFKRLYGMNLAEMSKKYNKSSTYFFYKHKEGTLEKYLCE